MSRKKKINKQEVKKDMNLSMDEKLKKARELRMRRAGVTHKQIEENTREEFRKYFVKVKRKLNLESSLENVIWLHFKASGFDKKDKFDEGLIHFGYKI